VFNDQINCNNQDITQDNPRFPLGHAPPKQFCVSDVASDTAPFLGRAFSVFPERNFYQSWEFLAFKNSRFCNVLYNFLQLHLPSFEATFALYAIISMK
jgi:hypothetical protein